MKENHSENGKLQSNLERRKDNNNLTTPLIFSYCLVEIIMHKKAGLFLVQVRTK